ncbi:hypothetical protein [Clostridium cellulovorans]|uniref:Uncharacterized protein n=1 Tax=Clostridium cellulovorans (strain ATCC 35296 / DSM 3052 / OCM 3 / 743B) TaxID=573061 RepID=D9SPQ9_CLOC7|nr:hypothetical protein [Clostridium cellulovorans]ADL50108.1 hypothetical protein Clocel_0328 [Clostridium cellulovorans 743B]
MGIESNARKGLLVFLIAIMSFAVMMLGVVFQGKLGNSVLIHNDLKTLETFKTGNTGFSYKIPHKWQYKEKRINDLSLTYYNSFFSEDNKITGTVQAIRYIGDIQSEIKEGKVLSEIPSGGDFNINNAGSFDGNKLVAEYKFTDKSGIDYNVSEYFFIGNEAYLKISFYLKEADDNNTRETILRGILKEVTLEGKAI